MNILLAKDTSLNFNYFALFTIFICTIKPSSNLQYEPVLNLLLLIVWYGYLDLHCKLHCFLQSILRFKILDWNLKYTSILQNYRICEWWLVNSLNICNRLDFHLICHRSLLTN